MNIDGKNKNRRVLLEMDIQESGYDFTSSIDEIIIKDGCWIGGQTVLLQGITVNDGAIIAAGAVVTKNVDADCLAGGVPAKTIRQL